MDSQVPQMRPRSKSGFSFKSDKSGRRSNSFSKHELKESHAEKAKSHFSKTTKANPNNAMNEAQPVAEALERPTLASLSSSNHLDTYGQPIVEPDLSNPTRPRWERPLDTIKSFEYSIDRNFRRQQQMTRPESVHEGANGFASRRSSFFGGLDQNQSSRFSQVGGGYYGGRNRESFHENGGLPPMAPPSRNRYGQRQQTDPNMVPRQNNGPGPYPSHGYQQSRDTVITGESSQSEPWGNSTEPSSENSSIDRVNSALGDAYNGYGGPTQYHGTIHEGRGFEGEYPKPMAPGQPVNSVHFAQNVNAVPPALPHKDGQGSSRLIKLGGASSPLAPTSGNTGVQRPAVPSDNSNEKRKSWFKRRFSKD